MILTHLNMVLLPVDFANTKSILNPVTVIFLNTSATFMSIYQIVFLVDHLNLIQIHFKVTDQIDLLGDKSILPDLNSLL
jgi:hypothetical protein